MTFVDIPLLPQAPHLPGPVPPAKPRPPGEKHDGGKRRWSLLPWAQLAWIVDVLEYGARKYSPDNWKHIENGRQRYYDALLRHVTDWWEGKPNDSESGLPHLAHAGCCLLFLMWFDENGEKNDGR